MNSSIQLGKTITGYYNAANGYQALYYNTTGGENTANGGYALYSNSIGNYNTATGYQALYFNVGDRNTAYGYQAPYRKPTARITQPMVITRSITNAAATPIRLAVRGDLLQYDRYEQQSQRSGSALP